MKKLKIVKRRMNTLNKGIKKNMSLVTVVIICIFVAGIFTTDYIINGKSTIMTTLTSLGQNGNGVGADTNEISDTGGVDDSSDEDEDVSPPINPWITFDLSHSAVPHHPRTPVTGTVLSNVPNARIILEEKLRGDVDSYDIPGWPHEWVETFSATTDSNGIATVPFTCVMPGMWEQRVTLIEYGIISEIQELEIWGVAVDVPQEVVSVAEPITIRVFSSTYSTPGFITWESTDDWITLEVLMTLTSDQGGYTYMTLHTGHIATHEFRAQDPAGQWSYNTESCIVNP